MPLEAQRLGLEAYASDLNPVAVLINKAMIEIPPRFAGRPPVHPDGSEPGKSGTGQCGLFKREWKGAQGLAEDVRYYGKWMRDEAQKRIVHLYPPVDVTAEMAQERPDLKPLVGKKLTVIAWLWARTVKSPNPAFRHVDVPLATTFTLSSKAGKETYVEPIAEGDRYRFTVKMGKPSAEARSGTTAGKRAAFRCLMSGVPIDYGYIRAEGKAGRMGQKLMAIVAEGQRCRVYLPPTSDMETVAREAVPDWKPEIALPDNPRDFKTPNYGLTTFAELFTPRQLVALTTFSDLVTEARERIRTDVAAAGVPDDGKDFDAGGTGALAYAEAVGIYLAFVVEKLSESHSSLCTWSNSPRNELVVSTFRRQAIPMTWDFGEANPFADSSGSLNKIVQAVCRVVSMSFPVRSEGNSTQSVAQSQQISAGKVISTDPPYYDKWGGRLAPPTTRYGSCVRPGSPDTHRTSHCFLALS